MLVALAVQLLPSLNASLTLPSIVALVVVALFVVTTIVVFGIAHQSGGWLGSGGTGCGAGGCQAGTTRGSRGGVGHIIIADDDSVALFLCRSSGGRRGCCRQ